MEAEAILMETELTPMELTKQLLKFQDMMAKMIFDGDNLDGIRMDEVISKLKSIAREKGLLQDAEVKRCIQDLKEIEKEICISVAGRNGESRVARTLSFATRSQTSFYHNVYVSNTEKETEIDTIVLTNQGIIVLEVKNSKTDITITEDGRLLYSNESCFHEKSICEKMKDKRQILNEKIKERLEMESLDIPICIDSYVVFSAPKGIHVNITDNCRREKYCFRGKLPYLINDYIGPENYSEEQVKVLKKILDEMDLCKKKFKIGIDFDQIRTEIAIVLVKLLPEKYECKEKNVQSANKNAENTCGKERVRANCSKFKYEQYLNSAVCTMGIAVIPLVGAVVASMITGSATSVSKMRT